MHLWWVMSLKWAPYHIFLSHISSNCITRNNHKKVLKKSYVKCYFLGITLISHNLLNSCPPQKEKLASVSVFCGCWLCSLQQLSTIPGIKQFQCHYRCCDTRREQRNLLSTHDLSIRQFISFERSQIKAHNLQNNTVSMKCWLPDWHGFPTILNLYLGCVLYMWQSGYLSVWPIKCKVLSSTSYKRYP